VNEDLALALWIACAHRERRTKDMMLAGCGRIAIAVGMGPLKGMSREMVFVKSGLRLGLISPTNDPLKRIEESQVLFEGAT
jgi:hypothetical protein